MRPGSVTTVAARNDKLLFGLSGNPSACYVGFELFVRPIIRTAYRHLYPHLRREQAILGQILQNRIPLHDLCVRQLIMKQGS